MRFGLIVFSCIVFVNVTQAETPAEFELKWAKCPTNAITFYRAKAEAGDPKAQFFMAKAYLLGIGCDKNGKMGFAWAKKSADGGFSPSMALLGYCYSKGMGVDKDTFNWVAD